MNHDRKRELSWFVLIGTMGYAWCHFHVRVDDRVWHEPMEWWDYTIDALWTASFVAAAVTGLRSDLRYRYPLAIVLLLMIPWRLFAQTGRNQWVEFVDLPLVIGLLVISAIGVGGARMAVLTVRQWLAAFMVSSLIVGAISCLLLLFAVYLPSLLFLPVRREDREVLEELRRMATGTAIVSGLCGAVLGALLPVYWRQCRKIRSVMRAARMNVKPSAPSQDCPQPPPHDAGAS